MKKAFVAALLFLLSYAFGQSRYISIIETSKPLIEADIINAAMLIDPFSEKFKEIPGGDFSLTIRTTSDTIQSVTVSASYEAYVTLEEDGPPPVLISSGHTDRPVLIPASGRVFTSNTADNPGSDISFTKNTNEEIKQKLKDKILEPGSGGKVPSGLYEFTLTIQVISVNGKDVTNDPAIVINHSINITNPTTAVLDVPYYNGYVYPTRFPQFQWTYNTSAVKLSVFEKRPEHQSLEDAINASDPYLEVEIARTIDVGGRKIPTNISSLTYPQTASARNGITFIHGPRPLERGKMYVVVLDGIRKAYGFDPDPLRTIRSFVIADPQGQMVMNMLLSALDQDAFQDFFNTIRDQNLQINLDGMSLNGVKISPQDLQKILNDNKKNIQSVRFEE